MNRQIPSLQQLIGTWRLAKVTLFDAAGNPIAYPLGPTPMGRLVLTESGRMMAVLCDGRPVMPHGEEREYSSYCGNYRVDNGRLITRVDAAAIQSRIGNDEVREISLRGQRLVLKPPPLANSSYREVEWDFAGPA